MKDRRFKRLSEITEKEEVLLEKTIKKTKGMVRYGNRARTAVMLPCDVAVYISTLSKINDSSISQTILDIIKESMAEKQ